MIAARGPRLPQISPQDVLRGLGTPQDATGGLGAPQDPPRRLHKQNVDKNHKKTGGYFGDYEFIEKNQKNTKVKHVFIRVFHFFRGSNNNYEGYEQEFVSFLFSGTG